MLVLYRRHQFKNHLIGYPSDCSLSGFQALELGDESSFEHPRTYDAKQVRFAIREMLQDKIMK